MTEFKSAKETEATPLYASKLPAALLRNCRVIPDRNAVLPLIPKGGSFCEVGVALGDFSRAVLDVCEISRFYAIDLFGLHSAPHMWNGRVGAELKGVRHVEYYKAKFSSYVKSDVMRIMHGDSVDMLRQLPDRGVDVFYIDAGHGYSQVKSELSIISTKISASGLIICNDYIMADWLTNTRYGVVQAVNEFMISEGWEMIFFALHAGMFCDVTLRKVAETKPLTRSL